MRKIINTLFISVLLFLDSSCIHEKAFDWENTGNPGEAEVILRLKTPSGFSSSKSRALSHADENAIADIHVLVFNKTNTLVAIKQGEDVTTAGSINPLYSGTGSFAVILEASKTTADTYKLVVLANAGSILSNTIGLDVSAIADKSYVSVTAEIWNQIGGPMYVSGGTIPMWGESQQLVIEPGNNNQTLELTRAVARIDVGVGKVSYDGISYVHSWDGLDADGNPIPFDLTDVYIIRPNNRYAIVPNTALAAGNPTVPTGTAAFSLLESENNFAFATPGGFTSRDIYIPEADILMGPGGKSGDANHKERMAVVVGGSYNGGTTTYYRLDFAKEGNLMNALRNHLYQFNISSVSGDGYPDVETAYNSLPMNMTVDILDWDETEVGNIVFDGQYFLGIKYPDYEFAKRAQSGIKQYITTDYPTGWSYEITDSPNQGGNPISPVWMRVTGRSNNGPGVTDELIFEVDAYTGSSQRVAYVHISAGRLSIAFKVVQTSAELFVLSLSPEGDVIFPSGLSTGDPIVPIDVFAYWEPGTIPANYEIKIVSNGGVNFVSTPLTGSLTGGGQSINITPSAFSAGDVTAGNPFPEKISRLVVTAYDGANGEISKNVLLRQKHFNLVTSGISATHIMQTGSNREYSFTVKANCPWEATVSGNAINAILTSSGTGNTSAGETFRYNMIIGSSSLPTGSSVIKFTSPEGKFEPVNVTINAIFGYVFLHAGNYYLAEYTDRGPVTYQNCSCPAGYYMPGDAIAGTMRINFDQLGLNSGRNYWTGSGMYLRVDYNRSLVMYQRGYRIWSVNYFSRTTQTYLDVQRKEYGVIILNPWGCADDTHTWNLYGGSGTIAGYETLANPTYHYRCIMPL